MKNNITVWMILLLCFCGYQVKATDILSSTKPTLVQEGNQFHWSKASVDSVAVLDPSTGEEYLYISYNNSYIYKVNQDSTYFLNQLEDLPKFKSDTFSNFEEYFSHEVLSLYDYIPQAICGIGLNTYIVDKSGKIIYHEYTFSSDEESFNLEDFKKTNPAAFYRLQNELDKIIKNAPAFKPGQINAKNVICLLPSIQAINIKKWS